MLCKLCWAWVAVKPQPLCLQRWRFLAANGTEMNGKQQSSSHNLQCLLNMSLRNVENDRKQHELLGHCLQIMVKLLLSLSPIFSFWFRFPSDWFHSFPRVDPLLLSGSLALTTQAVQLLPLRGFDGHLLARWADRMDRGWRWQCVCPHVWCQVRCGMRDWTAIVLGLRWENTM